MRGNNSFITMKGFLDKDINIVRDLETDNFSESNNKNNKENKISKGWENYNSACATGVVVKDYGFNKDNVQYVIKNMEEEIAGKNIEGQSGNTKTLDSPAPKALTEHQKQIKEEAERMLKEGKTIDEVAQHQNAQTKNNMSLAPKEEVVNKPGFRQRISNGINSFKENSLGKVGGFIKRNPVKTGIATLGVGAGIGVLGNSLLGNKKVGNI